MKFVGLSVSFILAIATAAIYAEQGECQTDEHSAPQSGKHTQATMSADSIEASRKDVSERALQSSPSAVSADSAHAAPKSVSADAVQAARNSGALEPVQTARDSVTSDAVQSGQNAAGIGTNISSEIREEPHVDPRVKELFSQAVHLLKINRAYQARDLLEQAAAIAPKSAGIHCNLGLAYQNSGNMPKALNEFKTALILNPHMKEATLNLAGCYQSMGENKDAIHWYTIYLSEINADERQKKQISDIISALKDASQKAVTDPNAENYLVNVTADGTYRWPKEKLPLRVFIQSGLAGSDGKSVAGFRQPFRDALLKSFEEWCAATERRLSYRSAPDKEHADIFCTWTADPLEVTENGTQSERGSAKIIVKGNNIERATLKILTRPILEEGVLSQDEMKKACLHEVGHVLGLQGHSTNNHDVMFFTVDTATVWPVLSKRDKATIAKLYQAYPASWSAKQMPLGK